jgi:Ca2+-binding RTX toxin-like protein
MRAAIALVVGTVALAAAAPASAGTVCKIGTTAVFAADDVVSTSGCAGSDSASEVNALKVDVTPAGDIVFSDSAGITDGDGPGGCTVSGATATCTGTTGYRFDLGGDNDSATIAAGRPDGTSTGGDGNDTLTGGPGSDALDGGPGNDTVSGGAGDDSLEGGSGDDVVSGGDGNDSLDVASLSDGCPNAVGDDLLSGDAGDDTLCGGPGPGAGLDNDAINGGDGVDRIFYPRVHSVSVSLDGAANDGETGEADNVRADVEQVTGGAGNDTLTGNDGPNLLDGGPGADTLNGLGGDDTLMDSGGDAAADTLNGGEGDDTLSAGRGPDVYNGGDGEDAVVDYIGRTVPVNVTIDGNANDGAAGEGDNVGLDVEDVTGGSAGDTLVGSAVDNELVGGNGNDTISGGDGNDGLSGGPGRDTIDGGNGRDLLSGGGGADTLRSRDGVTDRDECGGGTDSVEGEARDDISGDCENITEPAPAAVGIGSVVVTRAGFVVVRVTCPATERSCSGQVIVKSVRRLGRSFIRFGKVNYRLRSGASNAIRAKIPNVYRRALRRARRVKVRAVVSNINPDTGAQTNATKLATVITRGL